MQRKRRARRGSIAVDASRLILSAAVRLTYQQQSLMIAIVDALMLGGHRLTAEDMHNIVLAIVDPERAYAVTQAAWNARVAGEGAHVNAP